MKKAVFLAMVFMALWCMPSFAEMEIVEAVITTGVVDHKPADSVETYPASIGKLYCFTHVVGAQEDTTITHVWYFNDSEMARVTLPVRSSNWRTWSSKNFLPEWSGQWRVDVLDGEPVVDMA